MTKDDLVIAVVKSCKGDDLSKRLVSDVIDVTFDSMGFFYSNKVRLRGAMQLT